MKSLYREYDALAYNPKQVGDERGAINHIKKAKQRNKGVEIVFDPKAHKDFVTGFRKRKQQRRKEAEKQLSKKAKQQRVEDRAERRKEMKQQLGLPDDYGVQESDTEEAQDPVAAASKAEVKQYQQGGTTTTVSVMSLNMGDSESEPEAEPSQYEDQDDEQQQQKQRRTTGSMNQKHIKPGRSSLKSAGGKVAKKSSGQHKQGKPKKHKQR